VAKGNDATYLQHSVETTIAAHLASLSSSGRLHVALTHGMAPVEPCDTPPTGQTQRLLRNALETAASAEVIGASPTLAAYRATNASRETYPNTGELLAAIIGRHRLSGAITEVDPAKHAQLIGAWAGSAVAPVHGSWRREVDPGGALACPASLSCPWMFSMDAMTYREDGDEDDDRLHRADGARLAEALNGFVGSGPPGAATIFVSAVRRPDRKHFWAFIDRLADEIRPAVKVESCWITHQGGNRNLAAILLAGCARPPSWPPPGVNLGR
jgi:hypothetical protein